MSKSYRFVVETLLFLLYAAFGLSWIATTPLMGELQARFHVTAGELGLMTTVVAAAKVLAPLAAGWLALRIGLKRAVLVGAVCICVAAIAPFAPSFGAFLAGRFVFGLGGAVVVTLLSPMVMQWFSDKERPLVNAFNNVAVNTGITVTLFTTLPIASRLGWQGALTLYGGLSVLLAVLWAVFGREKPVTAAAANAQPEAPVRYRDVWRLPETWTIALGFSGPLALYLAFNSWLPRYYVEAFGMTKVAASHYTGIFNLVGIPTAILFGLATQRLGLRRPFIIGAGVLMGFAAFGMLLFPNPAIISASAVLLGISLFAYVAPLFTIPMELEGITARHVTLMMGTVFSFAYAVSSLSPVVAGLLRDVTGSFLPGLGTWAVFSWMLAAAGAILPETGPARKHARKPVATPLAAAAQ